jgi:hypothetical protein
MQADLTRLAAAAERIAAALEALAEARRDPLSVALQGAFGGSPFTAQDAVRLAARQAADAAALGQAPPALPAALEAAGIRSARSLARHLPALGARQAGREGQGCIWCF